jgi:hypothetical protein
MSEPSVASPGPGQSISPQSSASGGARGLSASPDWSSARALTFASLGVAALVCVILCSTPTILPGFRDTDDATRLELVRELIGGRGWYDQAVARLNPPHGVWMHWSRLLDGGIAALMLALRQILPAALAEYWTRYLWPLIWIFPAVAAALALARNLGARSAVFLAAAVMLVDLNAYRQFVPGRIDHHNLQITMAVVAMACATARARRAPWAIVGGAAAALGMAIGLEAMPLQALIGASYGASLVRDRDDDRATAGYGLALAATTLALFLIQTPPARWSMSFCDALALNLTAAVIVGGAGLALVGAVARLAPAAVRAGLLAVAGGAALAVYLALDPACIRGPFAAMNPAVKPFWFDRIQEVQPLNKMMVLQRGPAIAAAILLFLSLASALYLVARQLRIAGRWRLPDTATLLILIGVIEAAITAWFAWRMQDYVYWLGLPAFAAALSWIAVRRLKNLMLPSVVVALVLSPAALGAAVEGGINVAGVRKPVLVNAGPRCFARWNYRQLAALPPGNVMAPQDLGPFILVYTRDTAVIAPYHRMSNEILAVHNVWNAPPALAEARVRALHADYVVDCPPYPIVAGPGTFGVLLRKGPPPPWLRALSPAKSALKIYQVLPPVG